MDRERTLSEYKSGLGLRILQNCRSELYSLFPYLDGAFASLSCVPDEKTEGICTDGEKIFFSPDRLAEYYAQSPAAVRRGYLHILLHCLFLHLFRDEAYQKERWDLACDIVVEQIIEKEDRERLRLPLQGARERCLSVLGNGAVSAEQIYGMLEEDRFPFSGEELKAAFAFDDHRIWDRPGTGLQNREVRKKWEQVRAYVIQARQNHRAGAQTGMQEEEIGPLQSGKYDYRSFLRRFTFPREEVELDTECFDYIFYSLGMEHYGNMPLIEPLEYKEANRLEELVIAIDTSHSCSVRTVRRFLEETYGILSRKENFFRRMKVYIIQCDCSIQDVTVIRSGEEWKEYAGHVRIQGRSGTDFRPVFGYVEKLRAEKELRDLKALIYFTDGDGVYPRKGPDYETAFVFLREHAHPELAPPWARKLFVDGGVEG